MQKIRVLKIDYNCWNWYWKTPAFISKNVEWVSTNGLSVRLTCKL